MTGFLIGLALTFLILMGWLKVHMWRFNRSSERLGRHNAEQAHRDWLAASQATAEYCAQRDAKERQSLLLLVRRVAVKRVTTS